MGNNRKGRRLTSTFVRSTHVVSSSSGQPASMLTKRVNLTRIRELKEAADDARRIQARGQFNV